MPKISIVTPKPVFQPITLTIETPTALANVLGAIIAYGTASTYAENSLQAINLGEFYSGNVRKASREFAVGLAGAAASANVDLAGLEALVKTYLSSYKFKKSRSSKPGAQVPADETLSTRTFSTEFETNPNYVAPRGR
jgi:hypothetical protein